MILLGEEGLSKFKLTLKRAPAPEISQVIALEKWRALFYRLGLVGEYPNEKIGYGNLSCRLNQKGFLISGGQTGHLPNLQAHHYTKVTDCDLKKGSVSAEGLIAPSSDSLTHFSLYQSQPQIHAIFQVHHPELWEIVSLNGIKNFNELTKGIFAYRQPADGIIAFGSSVEEAGKTLLETYRRLSNRGHA